MIVTEHTRADLHQLVSDVTLSLVGADASPVASRPEGADGCWHGCVEVSGGWSGVVLVSCSPDLPRRVAASLFGEETGEVALDALAELTNVLAGNLKALLPGDQEAPLHLSPPVVARSPVEVTGARPLLRESYVCDGDVLTLSLCASSEQEAA